MFPLLPLLVSSIVLKLTINLLGYYYYC